MYAETSMVLAVMVIVFALASWKLKSPELSMVVTAIAGALAGGLGFPVRLLVEGTFTYFDVAFTFLTASIFINFYSETGAMDALVRKMVERFYGSKFSSRFLRCSICCAAASLSPRNRSWPSSPKFPQA